VNVLDGTGESALIISRIHNMLRAVMPDLSTSNPLIVWGGSSAVGLRDPQGSDVDLFIGVESAARLQSLAEQLEGNPAHFFNIEPGALGQPRWKDHFYFSGCLFDLNLLPDSLCRDAISHVNQATAASVEASKQGGRIDRDRIREGLWWSTGVVIEGAERYERLMALLNKKLLDEATELVFSLDHAECCHKLEALDDNPSIQSALIGRHHLENGLVSYLTAAFKIPLRRKFALQLIEARYGTASLLYKEALRLVVGLDGIDDPREYVRRCLRYLSESLPLARQVG